MNINKWFKLNTHDLSDVTIAITGTTGGIGEWICMHLARLNAKMIFLNRNIAKSTALERKIKLTYSKVKIQHIELDLENQTSISKALLELKNLPIDILILNAGIYNVPLKKMHNGYNNIFNTNFLSQYHIVKELLPTLSKSNIGKVVAVSSIAHNYSKINKEDVDFSNSKKPSKIYGNSKRFLMFALHELLKDSNIKLSITHPGITLTNMTNHYPKAINWIVKVGIKLLFPNPKLASLSIIKGIFDSTPYHTWIGPSLFDIWGSPKKKKLKTCTSNESQKIYEIAEDIMKKKKA